MSFSCTLGNFSFLAYSRFDRDRNESPQAGHFTTRANNGMATAIGFQPGSLFIFWRPPRNSQFKFLFFFSSDKSSACIKLNES